MVLSVSDCINNNSFSGPNAICCHYVYQVELINHVNVAFNITYLKGTHSWHIAETFSENRFHIDQHKPRNTQKIKNYDYMNLYFMNEFTDEKSLPTNHVIDY